MRYQTRNACDDKPPVGIGFPTRDHTGKRTRSSVDKGKAAEEDIAGRARGKRAVTDAAEDRVDRVLAPKSPAYASVLTSSPVFDSAEWVRKARFDAVCHDLQSERSKAEAQGLLLAASHEQLAQAAMERDTARARVLTLEVNVSDAEGIREAMGVRIDEQRAQLAAATNQLEKETDSLDNVRRVLMSTLATNAAGMDAVRDDRTKAEREQAALMDGLRAELSVAQAGGGCKDARINALEEELKDGRTKAEREQAAVKETVLALEKEKAVLENSETHLNRHLITSEMTIQCMTNINKPVFEALMKAFEHQKAAFDTALKICNEKHYEMVSSNTEARNELSNSHFEALRSKDEVIEALHRRPVRGRPPVI